MPMRLQYSYAYLDMPTPESYLASFAKTVQPRRRLGMNNLVNIHTDDQTQLLMQRLLRAAERTSPTQVLIDLNSAQKWVNALNQY